MHYKITCVCVAGTVDIQSLELSIKCSQMKHMLPPACTEHKNISIHSVLTFTDFLDVFSTMFPQITVFQVPSRRGHFIFDQLLTVFLFFVFITLID